MSRDRNLPVYDDIVGFCDGEHAYTYVKGGITRLPARELPVLANPNRHLRQAAVLGLACSRYGMDIDIAFPNRYKQPVSVDTLSTALFFRFIRARRLGGRKAGKWPLPDGFLLDVVVNGLGWYETNVLEKVSDTRPMQFVLAPVSERMDAVRALFKWMDKVMGKEEGQCNTR